ncbi:MAG: SapC family protein [Sphingomonas sp.]
MAEQVELLNAETHRHLRMQPGVADPHPHFVMIVLSEFPIAAASCPIFFAKDSETGEFYAAALFGFQPGELLVEATPQDGPAFRPLELQRQGFFAADENIAVDPDHPRFGSGATIALFDDDGTPSNALRKVQQTIGELMRGVEETRDFIQTLLGLRLIEPIDISLRFDNGEHLSLAGLYTVSRDNLGELADADVVRLFRSGFLQAALCASGSLSQIPVLARRRNARLTA